MWKVFFEQLGAETVISPQTSKDMLTFGCSKVVGDICLPVKVFCGHVHSLVNDCDYVFIPSLHSVQTKVYNCPKFIGLPDLVRATVSGCPPILDPDIDVNKGKRSLYATIYKLGRPFSRNPLNIRSTYEKALKEHRAYQEQMQCQGLTPPQVIGGMLGQLEEKVNSFVSTITIALVGHPYLVYDQYVNHELAHRLQKMGAKVVFSEMVAKDELQASISELVEKQYWGYEEEIIGAGGYYLRDNVDGLISLAAFGCGPDSMMVELLQRRARNLNKPLLNIVLDEHTAEGGLVTRLEAFVDMVQRQKKSPPKQIYINHFTTEEQEGIRVLALPNMASIVPAFRASVETLGVSLIMPPVTKHTISLGTRYSPEFACLPFKAILGTYIESLEMGADTLFMVTSSNACRMGYYSKVQEQILRDLGYKFKFLRSKESDRGLIGILRAVKRLANDAPWSKVIAGYRVGTAKLKVLDDLERKMEKVRAIELEKGQSNRIYREAIRTIDEVTTLSSLKQVAQQYFDKLEQVPKSTGMPLKVGIVGELYVVMEPFVNLNLEVKLGMLGVEVRRTRTTFFSGYTNLGSYLNLLSNEKKKLQKFALPYLKRDVGGHGLETVGEKVHLARGGYDGLVHLAPFTCMPEAIAQNVMLNTKEDIPVLTILCDEQMGEVGMATRLEAFVDLLERRRKQKLLVSH